MLTESLCVVCSFYQKKTIFVCLNISFSRKTYQTNEMNKNGVLAWATIIMVIVGLALIGLGAFRYDEVAGWGFASVGIGFFAIAWVFNALKGRV